MTLVFKDADGVFKLLSRLVRRPSRGESPEGVKGRNGIPVVCLTTQDQEDLVADMARALRTARPNGVLHESVDVPEAWSEVTRQRADLPDDWKPVELYRQVLVKLAQEYSSASNERDRRVRFRRFGLVNWLLSTQYAAEEPDPQHDRELLRGLREREFKRRRFFGMLRSPETEVALQGTGISWWVPILGLHVFPVVWFRAWRGVGTEYRWLLRQPYMAPRDPGTFVGFAMRLTQPRWGRESPEQVGKLMINAFLEDLRAEYRRRTGRRRRAARRTAYCVALLRGVSGDNHGKELLRSLVDVRNDTGAFDPLVVISSSSPSGDERPGQGQLSEDLYGIWRNKFSDAGRSRTPDVWYLPVTVPGPLREDDADYELHQDRLRLANKLEVDPPPRWARRRVSVAAAVVALCVLAGGVAGWAGSQESWEKQHCGLSRSDPDAATLSVHGNGECVGVAPGGYAFGSSDPKVNKTLRTLAEQNEEADRLHRDSQRPLVTLVHVSALLNSQQAKNDGPLTYAREQLQGAASAQRRQLDKRGGAEPVLRIYPASAGSQMRYGPQVVKTLERMMREDESIVGVTGLDQSRTMTITTIRQLTRIGMPMVATTPSADSFSDSSPMYYQVSPQNRRESAVAAAYASELAEKEGRERRVRIIYSADPSDEYSSNLRDDMKKSMLGADFDVEDAAFTPGSGSAAGEGRPGPRLMGEQACGYDGLVFYAGRAEDFATVLNGTDEACGSDPPTFLGGDDVARLAADPDLRTAYPKVPFTFLDFTMGSVSCDSESNLYSTMRELFPDECKQAPNTSLDGHATLAFDAVNLYIKALGQLRDTAPSLPLTAPAVWHALSSIHGSAALDGESGRIDFGGKVDRQIPLDKLISVQHVDGDKRPEQVGFCGRWGRAKQSGWCPEPERAQ